MSKKARRRRLIVYIVEQLIAFVLMLGSIEIVILAAAFFCRWAGVL